MVRDLERATKDDASANDARAGGARRPGRASGGRARTERPRTRRGDRDDARARSRAVARDAIVARAVVDARTKGGYREFDAGAARGGDGGGGRATGGRWGGRGASPRVDDGGERDARRTDRDVLSTQPSNKTFKVKKILGKKQKQNRPLPQWIRMRTGNTIRYVRV